jgi:hypothetical protein
MVDRLTFSASCWSKCARVARLMHRQNFLVKLTKSASASCAKW